MTVPEVLFTTWVGWPIYTALAILVGNGIYEHRIERREKQKENKNGR